MNIRFSRLVGSVRITAGLLCVCVTGGALAATTYYVATDGLDSNDGLTWATAKKTVASAVALPVDGDTVIVGDGTHVIPTNWLTIDKGIALISTNGPASAVLKAGNAISNERSVLNVNHSDALVSGFTIRDGYYNKYEDIGAGVSLRAGTVSNCTITACTGMIRGAVRVWDGLMTHCQVVDNGAFGGGSERKGGGAYITGGTIQFCDFISNEAPRGDGVCMENTAGVVRDCRFFGNSNNGSWDGGGMYMTAGLVDRCTFATNNALNYGGGLEVHGGLVRNTLVFDNTSKREGGGIRIGNANARLANVTIANNLSLEAVNGHGLCMTAGIASNGNVYKTGGTLVQSCSTPLQTGTGNIAADPLFVSSETSDFRLLPGSPCRDAVDSAPRRDCRSRRESPPRGRRRRCRSAVRSGLL